MNNKTTILNQNVTMDDITADDEFLTAAEFEDATRTTVRTLGKNFDCDVIFAGDGAKTDGKTVCLPAQDPSKLMTRKQYAVGQGFANHETLHNLCTDMTNLTSEIKRLKGQGKKLAVACAQAIEDVRIERAGATLYPGMPSQISSTADYAAKKFLEDYLPESPDMIKDFKRIGPLAITWMGRKRMGYDSPYIDKCLDQLEPDMIERLNMWCDIIEKMPTGATGPGEFDQEQAFRGSHESVRYAELLAREIDEIEKDEDEEEDDSEDGDGTRGAGGEACVDPISSDLDAHVMKLLAEGDRAESYRPLTTALDLVATRDNPAPSVQAKINKPSGQVMYRKVLADIGSRTAVMKRKLERALLTAAEEQYVSGQRTGRLDLRRHAVTIMKGGENVCKKKMDGMDVDTAVTILVDISGSMSGHKMALATQVCIALAECFEKTPVSLEILCFSGGTFSDAFPPHIVDAANKASSMARGAVSSGKLKGMWHRYEAMNMWVIKDFNDSLREAKGSLGCMYDIAHGNNPDGDALLHAAKRLKRRKAGKHIMLVLSDGQPAYGHLSGCAHEYTKMCADYVTKLGINLVGIGITDSSVRDFYKNWAVVNNLADLDKSVMDKIAKLILGENFRVDNADVSHAAKNFKSTRAA